MSIGQNDLIELARLIEDKIKEEFQITKLSGNLADSVKIVPISDTEVRVEIDAKKYDLSKFKKTGVVVPKTAGKTPSSYAHSVDTYGGFSGTHQDFVMRSVKEALEEWQLKIEQRGMKIMEGD